MNPVWTILISLIVGAVCLFVGYTYRKTVTEQKIDRSEETARRMLDDAVRKADEYKKEKMERVAEASRAVQKDREALEEEKAKAERNIQERRAETQRTENRLLQREASLDKRSDSLDNRENDLTKRSEALDNKLADAENLRQEAEALHQKQTAEL